MAAVLKHYAVSIVYERPNPYADEQLIVDEEGMLVGFRAKVERGCTTGFATATTAGAAIAMVRGNVPYGRWEGWQEQITQTCEVHPNTHLREWAVAWVVYWLKWPYYRVRRYLRNWRAKC